MLDTLNLQVTKILQQVIQGSMFEQLSIDSVYMVSIGIIIMALSVLKKTESFILMPLGFAIIFANIPGLQFTLSAFESALQVGDIEILTRISQVLGLEAIDVNLLRQAFLDAPLDVKLNVSNLLESAAYYEGVLSKVYKAMVLTGFAPILIFFSVGVMTDLSALFAKPKIFLLAIVAQLGVFAVLIAGLILIYQGYLNIEPEEIFAISLMGGGDGSLLVYAANKLESKLFVVLSAITYFMIAILPIIQTPIMNLLVSDEEKKIRMRLSRVVSKPEKIVVVMILFMLVAVFLPVAIPYLGVFCFGNVLKESLSNERLLRLLQYPLLEFSVFLLVLALGSQLTADMLLTKQALGLSALCLLALILGTVSAILFAKLMNLFSKEQVNPLIAAACIAAIPVSAKNSHYEAQEKDNGNYLIMYAIGASIAGFVVLSVITSILLLMSFT